MRSPLQLLLLLSLPLLLIPATGGADGDAKGLFDKAFPRLENRYLHPDAMDPAAMTAAGIQRLERASPDVLVLEDGPGRLQVWSGDRAQVFRTDDVATVDGVRARVDEAVAFVASGREGDDVVDPDDLRVQALHGILYTVDRHSRLIVGDGVDEFNDRFKGTLTGIGARIGRRRDADGVWVLKVVEPFDDAPAGRAGLRKDDVITHIDGHSTTALSVEAAVGRIRGPKGVPVVLTVLRPGETERRVFVIVRAKVRVPSVEHALLPGGIGLITIDHFSQKTDHEVAEAIDALELQVSNELFGLVLDLRGNTGGSMRKAARIVNHFVPEGMLVRTEGSDGGPVAKLTPIIEADKKRLRWTKPVAVLVDRRTASGSEILAGGLKYNDRAITIGTQTFGKGTVQKVYGLRDAAEGEPIKLKLTVARWLLPGDTFINRVGVTPDVATGSLYLHPDEPLLPEQFREPPAAAGRVAGAHGLDARKNPGGGREPMRDGVNAEPVLHLFYPRVADAWDGENENENESENESADERRKGEDGGPVPGFSDLPGEAGDDKFNDVELRLAWEILIRADEDDRRPELIEIARPLVAEMGRAQADRMAAAAAAGDIPWDAAVPRWMDRAPARESARQEAMRRDPPAGLVPVLHLPDRFVAGESTHVRLEVTNRRPDTVRHLRARIESSTDILDDAGFLLGDLAPGETRGWTVPVDVDPVYRTRLDVWRLYLIDDDGPLGGPFGGIAETRGIARPELSLNVATEAGAEEDGSAIVTATIKVRNGGAGDAGEIRVHFGDPRLDGVERRERFATISELAAGESAEVQLSLRVRDPAAHPTVPVRLRARDDRSSAASTLALDVPSTGGVRSGWREPAVVTMSVPHSSPEAPPARGSTDFSVRGAVEADAGLASVTVSVSGDQVFSRKLSGEASVEIEAKAILEVGPNRVRVVAETADGVEVRRTFWVLGVKEE